MIRRNRLEESWASTPIVNHVFVGSSTEEIDVFLAEQMNMHGAPRARGLKPVQFIKERLGKQNFCWQGEFRYWVWERNGWRVFVSNTRGIGFEVDEKFTREQALAAWHDFLAQIGVR